MSSRSDNVRARDPQHQHDHHHDHHHDGPVAPRGADPVADHRVGAPGARDLEALVAQERLVTRVDDDANGLVTVCVGFLAGGVFVPDGRFDELCVSPREAVALAVSLLDHASDAFAEALERTAARARGLAADDT